MIWRVRVSSCWRALGALGLLVFLTACASAPGTLSATSPRSGDGESSSVGVVEPLLSRKDPWENFNRSVYSFNEAVDEAVLAPVARTYARVVPDPIRNSVRNVFANVSDVWSALNHFLQGKIQSGTEQSLRVVINTFIGLGGLADVATDMNLPRHKEDLGQTLGRWGVGPGPYLVLPLLGPSTLRDTAALPADRAVSLSQLPEQAAARYALTGLDVVQTRAQLLGATRLMEQVAFDKYLFTRDLYLAKRQQDVRDGAAPDAEEQAEEDEDRHPDDPR